MYNNWCFLTITLWLKVHYVIVFRNTSRSTAFKIKKRFCSVLTRQHNTHITINGTCIKCIVCWKKMHLIFIFLSAPDPFYTLCYKRTENWVSCSIMKCSEKLSWEHVALFIWSKVKFRPDGFHFLDVYILTTVWHLK